MIYLYRILGFLFFPLLLVWMIIRIIKGKEDLHRISERFGVSGLKKTTEDYIWIHAASVGESLVALTLTNALIKHYPNYKFIITSGTITSEKIISSRLPNKAIHQFIPIDEYFAVNRFFKTWKPKLGILIESEIWPNLLDIGARYCPLILTNAIMSDKSLHRWLKYRKFASFCLNKFSLILCQSESDKAKYQQLSHKNIEYIGNLKYSANKPLVDKIQLEILTKQIGNRPILLAASTHPGDEEIIIHAHRNLQNKYPELLIIIAPRHPHRSREIADLITKSGLNLSIRSNQDIIRPETNIYLADALGEMGLFFSLAQVTFIGGSFANGGHNIIEPAFFDTNIIVGPDMKNSIAITKEFLNHNALLQAQNQNDLIAKIDFCLSNPTDKNRINNAKNILKKNSNIVDRYTKFIDSFIDKNGTI